MSTPTFPVAGGRYSVAGGQPGAAARPFDLAAAWTLNPKVALRPEPFGALLYHFGTRKLSFLKNLTVVRVVASLDDYESAEAALRAAGVAPGDDARYVAALCTLADSSMIVAQPG